MQLQYLFRPEDIVLGLDPPDKWQAIDAMMDALVASGRVDADQRDDLATHVVERERSMSTGMERGIAIPHAAVEGLSDIAACLGIVAREEGLAFESLDARPTRLVVLLLIPKAQKLLHIRTLHDVARVLSRDDVREALLEAKSREQAWAALDVGEVAAS